EAGVGQVGAREVGAGKDAAVGFYVTHVGVGETGAVHHRYAQVRLTQPRAGQVQAPRFKTGEIALEQIAAGAAGAAAHTRDLAGVLGRGGQGGGERGARDE